MHEEIETDPLAAVLDLMETYDHVGALEALRGLDVSGFSSEDQGRATAIEAVCLDWEGRSTKASGILRKALSRFSKDESFMLGLGVQLSELDELDEAERILRQLCEAAPTSAEARYQLACTLVDADKKEESLLWFDAAIACDSKFAPAFCGKAWCLRESGRLTDAATAYRSYLALEPDQAIEWVSLGVVESDLGRFDAAVAAYEQAQQLEPDSTTLHYNWLITACRQGDAEKAEECVQRLEEIAAEDWRTMMGHAHVAEMQGQIWQGWEACQEAISTALQEATDFDELHDAAVAALQFILRNELFDEAAELVENILDAGLFSDHIFRAVRRIGGRHSNSAFEFLVLVGGTIQEDNLENEAEALAPERDVRSFTYGRSYVVYAENAEEAGRAALDFESRYVGGLDLHIDAIEQRGGPTEADLGIVATVPERTIFQSDDE